jgi:hypothetical protein
MKARIMTLIAHTISMVIGTFNEKLNLSPK